MLVGDEQGREGRGSFVDTNLKLVDINAVYKHKNKQSNHKSLNPLSANCTSGIKKGRKMPKFFENKMNLGK